MFLIFLSKFDKERDRPNIRDVKNQIDSFYITSLLQSIFILLRVYCAYSVLLTTSFSARVSASKERLLSNLTLGRSFHYRSSHWRDRVEYYVLPRRVTRKHGRAYTRGCRTKVYLFLSLRTHLLSSSTSSRHSTLIRGGQYRGPTRSWLSCSRRVLRASDAYQP